MLSSGGKQVLAHLGEQLNSHDCGVAALLYAERCGLGHSAEEINTVTQVDLSAYRQLLKDFTSRVQQLD